ncbi:DMT family transporter [Sulfitobacter sp. D35]|uniref:DMT family transporter n=1 Tax=Sulfitobacter sp. D35 TaxID=3083252 RepID=UPI00296EAF49|nr:DMT family transporter [Sulfitobacter sp. D35]MDW4497769.1 DMT family transporter [Sulfitobacter sp. D35]
MTGTTPERTAGTATLRTAAAPDVPQEATPAQTLRAALWMLGSIASFSSMAVAGRELAGELDTFEIMTYRSLIGLFIVLVVAGVAGTLHQVNTRSFGTQIARNIAHFTGQNLWFYAVTVIPLAQVFALEFTSPLWVIVLSPIFLGERLTRTRAFAAVMGFVGILIVARPDPAGLNLGIAAAASCAIFFATTAILTKRLTRTQSITCIMVYLTATQLVFGLIASGYDGNIALPGTSALPWVIIIAVAGLVAHYCLTTALSIAPATVVMPMDFIRLPAIAIIAMLLYAEPLDPLVFLGAAIIFGGNYLNIWRETRAR